MNPVFKKHSLKVAGPLDNNNCDVLSARIMVAEDDVDLRSLIAHALLLEGHQVDIAENGLRAWKSLHLKSYDLLITDNNMPEMSGLQLVQKLRSTGSELPILLASGSLPENALLNDPILRFAAVISKPFSLGQLTRTVNGILASKSEYGFEITPAMATKAAMPW